MSSYNIPTGDFVTTSLSGVLAAGATSGTIGTGLTLPATNGILHLSYDTANAIGATDGPETIFYASYTTGTGAIAGLVRGLAGTTDVQHSSGQSVQSTVSSLHLRSIPPVSVYASGTGAGDFSTTSTTFVDCTNGSMTYTNNTPSTQTLILQGEAPLTISNATYSAYLALTATGTGVAVVQAGRARVASTTYTTVPVSLIATVTAENTATIKFQMASSNGSGTAQFGNGTTDSTWKITGLAIMS